MKTFLLFSILIFSVSVSGQMNPAQTDVESICNVTAYVIDQDPKGLNVRAGASLKSKILGKIPFDNEGTAVDLIASKGNWVKIEKAYTVENDSVFSRTGWVYAPLLAVATAKPGGREKDLINVYERPSRGNDVIAELEIYNQYKLAGCFENWVRITIPRKSGSITGWLQEGNHCGQPWTTCS